ncbi:MAG TPA: hypothetical protein VK921_17310 [Anditalea sp.]|nr:hypothetical protein [Anditalea sp.]
MKYLNTSLRKLIIFVMGCFFVFLVGYGVGKYGIIDKGKDILLNNPEEAHGTTENFLSLTAFTDELIESEKLLDPIESFDEINKLNHDILIELGKFENLYDKIAIVDSEIITLNNGQTTVVKLSFQYQNKTFYSYAYQVSNPHTTAKNSALIIPGSGHNQSFKIYNRKESNYHHGILEFMEDLTDFQTYIFIKPNEGILAFHNGNKKLNYNFITNFHLNQGGSYSASYLLQSIAFQIYLKELYQKNLIVGLSQGGLATLLNALESDPDYAVIASGYSVINYDKVEWSGHDQIIIPGISKELRQENLSNRLQESNTSWFFSYGKQEKGTYRIEADELWTQSIIGELSNVKVIIHEGGHQFPFEELKTFIEKETELICVE